MKAEIKKSSIEGVEAKIAEHVANESLAAIVAGNESNDDLNETGMEEDEKLLEGMDSIEDVDDSDLIEEAAVLTTSAYDLLQRNYDDTFSRISLPDHLR